MKSKINLSRPFVDSRGLIQNILNKNFGSFVIIESNKGSIRANHYHKRHWHYCYILSGEIEYYSMHRKSNKIKVENFLTGDLFFTPPQVIHAMYFKKKTIFATLGNRSRSHRSYENDLVRVTDFFKK